MDITPLVVGLAGPVPTDDQRRAIRLARPAGVILFARNVVDPAQLRGLTDDLRDLTGRPDLAVMIDQEGGPVVRMAPPRWPDFPAGPAFAAIYAAAPMTAIQAARANGEALGLILAAAGITMNAAPMLDVAQADSDPVVAARALGSDPLVVAALGRALLEGMATAGVTGIVKHLPGHGRATVDSHHALPVVDADAAGLEVDLAPFHRLVRAGAKAGMVGHVLYPAWDAARPASLSATIIDRIIRGAIGFDGLLISDDLHMGALTGSIEDRAAAAVAAGCDLALCCHADPAAIVRIADRLGPMTTRSIVRLDAARTAATHVGDCDEAIRRRETLFAASHVPVRLALPATNA